MGREERKKGKEGDRDRRVTGEEDDGGEQVSR